MIVILLPLQDNPTEQGRGGEEGDPVPLHGVAVPQQSIQQRTPRVQKESQTSDEYAPGDPGWSRHRSLQVSIHNIVSSELSCSFGSDCEPWTFF